MRPLALLLVATIALFAGPAASQDSSYPDLSRPLLPPMTTGLLAQAETPGTSEDEADLQSRIEALRAEREAIGLTGPKAGMGAGAVVGGIGLAALAFTGFMCLTWSWACGTDGFTAVFAGGGAATGLGGIALVASAIERGRAREARGRARRARPRDSRARGRAAERAGRSSRASTGRRSAPRVPDPLLAARPAWLRVDGD